MENPDSPRPVAQQGNQGFQSADLQSIAQAILQIATPTINENLYKFRVTHNATQNSGNGAFAAMSWNTETLDTNSNFASSEYTAPVNGYYMIGARARTSSTSQRFMISIYVDTGGGYAELARGVETFEDDNQSAIACSVQDLVYLNAGEKVKIYSFGNTTLTIDANQATTCFFGILLTRA